ncbi:MAG: TlpA family protein disulfide reductase [Deltaproteobacteria bacterium]|nr:TlpA family protein disulfide reductase [Deltaproteobacteria bacterium]
MKKFIILILMVFVFAGCNKENAQQTKSVYAVELKAGSPAVDFLYKDIDGNPFRLSGKKGEVVILYFWRMKCPECMNDMRSLDELSRKYKEKGLLVAAINADSMHSAPFTQVQEFLKEHNYAFLNIRDDEGFVSEAYNIIKAPHAFIIDKNSVIVSVKDQKTGWMDADTTKLIESLL